MNATDMRDELLAAWGAANDAYLQGQLRRLRLLLKRRALWLRGRWRQDPLQEYRGLLVSDTQADLLFSDGRADERRFYASDPEAAAIGEELAALERELDAKAEGNGRAQPAVELLASLFGLSRFERDAILLCLAPELDPAFERIYAYVQDDNARTYPCAHLAAALFAGEGEAAAETTFGPQSALLRFGLVVVEPAPHPGTALAARPLRLPPRIVEYARGTNHIDDAVAGLVRPVSAAPLSPAHTELVERLQRALERSPSRRPGVNLVGPSGCGKRAVARGLCERLGLQLLAVDTTQVPPSGPAREEALRLLQREAALLRLAFYLAEPADAHDRAAVVSFDDLIERLRPFVIVGSERRLASKRYLPAAVPAPGTREQRSLWNDALSSAGVPPRPVTDALAQQFHFGPAAIVGAVGAARARAALRGTGPEGVGDSDLWDAGRDQAAWSLDDLAQRLTPAARWDDIVLPEDVLTQLREIAAQVANRAQVYDRWGFSLQLGRGRGITALFGGPSGTGKTMAAEILASELELDLYRVDLAGLMDKYVGETEKNLRSVFDAAERSGSILFFDEADALFGKRTEVKDSHDRYANIEVNYLLQRMEDYRGLAILATNRKAVLDRAFLRRLRFLVDFTFPDATSRRRIWEKVFPEDAELGKLDFAGLARLELSGGHIKTIAVNAAFLAADEHVPIAMTHVMHAARREYAKLDRSTSKTEFGRYHQAAR
jgi:hypothetical protein